MSAWTALSRGTRILILALGGAGAAGVSYLAWQTARPGNGLPAAEDVAAAEAPAPEAVAAPPAETPIPAAVATESAKPALEADADAVVTEPVRPNIDAWRAAPDGDALVAGMASPGAMVEVLVDGTVVAAGEALSSGEFVLQFTLAPNDEPSLMWLSMTAPGDKAAVASAEMVALGPIEGPKLAAAEPAPEGAEAEEVAAPEPPAALLVTDEGAVVLQDAAPTDPGTTGQVTIDTIAYSPAGDVQLGGRGAEGAALRIYLDNAKIGDVTVPDGGVWLITLGDTAPGVYTLRVDQVDALGKVTSRFETPFKRETLEALAAATGQPIVPEADPAAAPETAAVTESVEIAAAEPTPEPAAQLAPEATTAPEAPDDSLVVTPAAPEVEVAKPDAAVVADAVPEAEQATELAAEAPPVAAAVVPDASASVTMTVQPGFTLWGIAQESYGDGLMFVQVFEANRDKIKNPDLIYPGQVLAMPGTP